MNPAKAKRILANRLSAARSKMKAKSQDEVCLGKCNLLHQRHMLYLHDALHRTWSCRT